MADILHDNPDTYAADPEIQDTTDAVANEFRASLRSLNRLARGFAGLPRYNVRSVLEFGAVGDGTTNDRQAFQGALASFDQSGGTLWVPPGTYLIDFKIGFLVPLVRAALTIPRFVHVQGAGIGRTVLEFRFHSSGKPQVSGIRFADGDNYGRVGDLLLRGDPTSPIGSGLSFAGSQFNVATYLQVWNFAIGVDMSDGVTEFSAYNELSNFLVSQCPLGVRCYRHGNGNWIERGRVFWAFRLPPPDEPDGDGTGVGIDVDTAQALSIRSVAIESANTCFRFRASGAEAWTTCEMSGCYFEPTPPPPEDGEDPPPPPGPYRIFDISYPSRNLDPAGITYLRLGANRYEGTLGRLDVPPEALADFGAASESPFGAHTHFAAHAHRQYSENHDLRLYDSSFVSGAWQVLNGAEVVEERTDVFSGGRTLRITRTSDTNPGVIRKHIVIPEDVEWVTIGFRYKNISCHDINYFASNVGPRVTVQGANGGDLVAAGNEPPGKGFRERWLQLRKDPSTDEIIATIEVNHPLSGGPQLGAELLMDAIWCVPGRVRTADFRYEQRVYYLERPQLIVERTNVVANEEWSVDWSNLSGLAAAARGAVGAILSVQITAISLSNGQAVPGPIYVTVAAPTEASPYSGARVYAERDGRLTAQQIAMRPSSSAPTTLSGSFATELGVGFPANYQIYIVGWILG